MGSKVTHLISRQIAVISSPCNRRRSESLPLPTSLPPLSLGTDQATGPGLLPQTHRSVLGLGPPTSSTLQLCESRPLCLSPPSWLFQAGAQARGLWRPSMKHEARAPAPNLLSLPSSAPAIKPAVCPGAGGEGGGNPAFHIPCCPSAVPGSGHLAQSGGKGETRTTFTSKSFCLKPLQQNHGQRSGESR